MEQLEEEDEDDVEVLENNMCISVDPSLPMLVRSCARLGPPQESASAGEPAAAIGPSMESASASEPRTVEGAPSGMRGMKMASNIAVTTVPCVSLVDVCEGIVDPARTKLASQGESSAAEDVVPTMARRRSTSAPMRKGRTQTLYCTCSPGQAPGRTPQICLPWRASGSHAKEQAADGRTVDVVVEVTVGPSTTNALAHRLEPMIG